MIYRKKVTTVKQIKKNIDYQTPKDRRACNNCRHFHKDTLTHSHSTNLKCGLYYITIAAYSICNSYSQK